MPSRDQAPSSTAPWRPWRAARGRPWRRRPAPTATMPRHSSFCSNVAVPSSRLSRSLAPLPQPYIHTSAARRCAHRRSRAIPWGTARAACWPRHTRTPATRPRRRTPRAAGRPRRPARHPTTVDGEAAAPRRLQRHPAGAAPGCSVCSACSVHPFCDGSETLHRTAAGKPTAAASDEETRPPGGPPTPG